MDSLTGDAAADGLLSASPGSAPGVDAVRSSIATPAASPSDVPTKVQVYREHRERTPMGRPWFGTKGRRIQFLSNHFNAELSSPNVVFYHYSVSITSLDNNPVNDRWFRSKVMDKLYQTYTAELEEKCFAYDGDKSLFTVGPLPQNNYEFVVILEESSWKGTCSSPSENDQKRSRRSHLTEKFNVEIAHAANIPLKPISLELCGNESENTLDALRVLDIVLRQQHAITGHLLVRLSFFSGDHMDYADLGGDVSTTTILTPGPVVNFLLANQNVRGSCNIDWPKHFHALLSEVALHNLEEQGRRYPPINELNIALQEKVPALEPCLRVIQHAADAGLLPRADVQGACLDYAALLNELTVDHRMESRRLHYKEGEHTKHSLFGLTVGRLLLMGVLDFAGLRETLELLRPRRRPYVFLPGIGAFREAREKARSEGGSFALDPHEAKLIVDCYKLL